MKDRVKELIENHTIDELAQMVADLEAELSVKENMKIVEDCIKKDDEELNREVYKFAFDVSEHLTEQIEELYAEVNELHKEIAGIRERLSDDSVDNLQKQENEIGKPFVEIRKKRTRPVKMTIHGVKPHKTDLSDLFDELIGARGEELSRVTFENVQEMPLFAEFLRTRYGGSYE